MHEFGHGLGFSGSTTVSGTQGGLGLSDLKLPTTYDRFVENGSGQSLINTALFPNPSSALGAQLTSNNVFFNGANANAANGSRPKLYSPTTWSGGSSIAHLDDGTYDGTINALMTHAFAPGESIHQPSPITFGMFQDIGWNMNTEGWMYGTPGNNLLDGTSIAQRIYGLEGQDTLNGSSGNDFLDGGLDNDTLSGGGDNDTIFGGGGDDYLVGVLENDLLYGGVGNDKYLIGNTTIITEYFDEGSDTVETYGGYTLGENLENLTLLGVNPNSGTGNALNNTIIGNAAHNLLDGSTGSDTMRGQDGDDTYIVDSVRDIVIEDSSTGGIDDVVWSDSSYTLSANIERLTLFSGAITGTGNDLNNLIYAYEDNNTLSGLGGNDTLYGGAGSDILTGGADNDILTGGDSYPTTNTGNDTLDGGSGDDVMNGQDGNDSYSVDSTGDIIIEDSSAGGTDTVYSVIN